MPQMQHRRPRACISTPEPGRTRRREVHVLVPPADEPHVDAVYGFEVGSRDSGAEAVLVSVRCEIGEPRAPRAPTVARSQMPPAAYITGSTYEKSRSRPAPDRLLLPEETARIVHSVEGASSPGTSRGATPAESRDEVTARDAVAVNEDELITAGGRGAEVSHTREPEPLVRLPGVYETFPKRGSPAFDDRLSRRRRAVVGDNDLEICVRRPASPRSTASSAAGQS